MERGPQTIYLDEDCGRNTRIARPTFAANQRSRTLAWLAFDLDKPDRAALLYRQCFDLARELDDDGLLIADDVFARLQRLYEADPALGIVSFRIADEQGQTLRRHVPRLRAGDPLRRGPVTLFLGGGHALSAPMLRQIGYWPDCFFFEHEETDLAWRALDAGWDIRYEPDLVLQHPRTSPARHTVHYRLTARNRVWLARRRLPAVLVPAYLGVWIAITLARTHSAAALRVWAAGFWEGIRTPCGPRQPMKWQTVWRMTRLGRPPLI